MVNFNLRLRNNIYKEWRDDYIDYKRLKKKLKKQQQIDEQLSQAASTSLEIEDEIDTKIKSSMSDSAELQQLLYAPVEFEDLLDAEYEKVEKSYKRHLTEFSQQFQLLRDMYRKDAPDATQESIKNSLGELHRLLNHLNNFALLNYTGFIKILKKHDKMFPALPALRREHTKRLQKFEFAEAAACRKLIENVENMFAEIFCDGNKSVAVASLMTKREDFIDWAHIYIGIKIGSCLILLVWVIWDSLIVPTFKKGKERHIIDL
jgi:SPX domain protein involved in polyphosphate accumulation